VKVLRCANNPIIEPKDVKPSKDDFEVIGVFNAGVTRVENEVILLLRVAERPISKHPDVTLTAVYDVTKGQIVTKEFSKGNPDNDFSDPRLITTPAETYLTSISHLRLARSKDGIAFEIEDTPAISPANDYETFGLEDPRISLIDGTHYISYVGVCPRGVTTCLISTKDYPRRILPLSSVMGLSSLPKTRMWYFSQDKLTASITLYTGLFHLYLRDVISGWRNGWLEVYHGADKNNRYCLGTVLLDSEKPWKVIARTEKPIFEPQADYECDGFFGNVVFSCGLLCEDDKLKIYYGAADTVICYAELSLKETLEDLNL
jgi:predicted GH43/DUF377 family glycosyl hydrolase